MTTTKLPELPEGKYPATYSYVARLVRIFTEHPADDTSALVLLAYGEACRATAPGRDGFVMVPVEATEAMLRAGRECIPAPGESRKPPELEHAYYVYRAMIAAAPAPPAEPFGADFIRSIEP